MTRQERFKKQREKMLAQLGKDGGAAIEAGPESTSKPTPKRSKKEEEAIRVLENWDYEKEKEKAQYERKMQAETDKIIEEGRKRTNEALAKDEMRMRGRAGPIESFLFDWNQTGGQNVFGVLFMLLVLPISIYAMFNEEHWFMYFFMTAIPTYLFSYMLSVVIAPAFLWILLKFGPKYTVEFNDSNPVRDTIFGVLNFLHVLIGRGYIALVLLSGFVVTPLLIFPSEHLFTSTALVIGGIASMFFSLVFYLLHFFMCVIYEAFATSWVDVMSRGKYRLNYLFDGNPMCDFRSASKSFPTIEQRKKVFKKNFICGY